MRRDTLERALYELTTDRATRTAFAADPDRVLTRYALDDDTRQVIKDVDVRVLVGAGVNPMLAWGYWMMCEGGGRADYLAALRGEEASP